VTSANFIDHIKIYCRSGSGGAGSVHFRREKFEPKGGPDGGDGGRGGHVILRGNDQLWTLLHLRYKRHIRADHGQPGGGSRSTGADGEDIIIDVPLGTVARDGESGDFLMEITEHDQEMILLEGGKGGLGNWNFRSSVNQTPRYAQPGIPGKESAIVLELKLLADVGLVGFPNAGKSTLLSVLSAAKPKIANYPFTTLKPNLGIVFYRDNRSFVMADIPGIIEGAHAGKGLGLRFLRHIERNSLLLFLVAADTDNIPNEYHTLLNELEMHNPELLDKPRLLVISKADLLDEELKKWIKKEIPENIPHLFISAVANQGLEELKDQIWKILNQ
jgi:GTP-binding protein